MLNTSTGKLHITSSVSIINYNYSQPYWTMRENPDNPSIIILLLGLQSSELTFLFHRTLYWDEYGMHTQKWKTTGREEKKVLLVRAQWKSHVPYVIALAQ